MRPAQEVNKLGEVFYRIKNCGTWAPNHLMSLCILKIAHLNLSLMRASTQLKTKSAWLYIMIVTRPFLFTEFVLSPNLLMLTL